MYDNATTGQRLYAALPKVAPGIATSTVLILARVWNAQGAEHSTGDAILMTALTLGTGAAGFAVTRGLHGDSTTGAIALTASGTLAAAGVAAYSDGIALPLLLWAVATTLAYVLAAKHWRTDRRDQLAHDRHLTVRQGEHRHVETVESIRARTQIEVARESTAYATALAEAITARAALPGFDPLALAKTDLPALPAADYHAA